MAAVIQFNMSMKTPERPLHDYVAEVSEHSEVRRGVPLPLGTHESEGRINFILFSRHASRVRLELFDQPVDATPAGSPCASFAPTAHMIAKSVTRLLSLGTPKES